MLGPLLLNILPNSSCTLLFTHEVDRLGRSETSGNPRTFTLSSLQVRLDGAVVTHFLPLEAALDASVGGTVTIEVERGGAPIAARLAVRDLHAVTPAAQLQVCGSVLHALSYQQARTGSHVFLCSIFYVFVAPCCMCYIAAHVCADRLVHPRLGSIQYNTCITPASS